MLRTYLGPVEDETGLAFLRPETAQGIFINYKNVLTTSRKKIPFGIGQQGKSFRNEITPGNFIFRTREFEQMEMEFFVKPGTDEDWFKYWIDHRLAWWTGLGVNPDNLRKFEHPKEKLSHYSKGTVDIEYRFGFVGSEWGELEGIANRTDFDLSSHQKASGVDLSYLDQESGDRYTPVRHRARGRRGPRHAGLPPRRLQRGRGAGRQGQAGEAHGPAPRPAPRPGQGRGPPAVPQRRPVPEGQGHRGDCSASGGTRTSTTPRRSAAATAARTRSARRSASRSTSTPWKTRPSRSASATRWPRSAIGIDSLVSYLSDRLPLW